MSQPVADFQGDDGPHLKSMKPLRQGRQRERERKGWREGYMGETDRGVQRAE